MRRIVVADYDPVWPTLFEQLRARLWPAIEDVALRIEHIGSTSVEGLAAKPIIDMTIVVANRSQMPTVIDRLARIGYRHRGDLGVPGREAFATPQPAPPHHLYACVDDCLQLRNHLAVRDHLRQHPADADAYAQLKKQLAQRFPDDIEAYIDGKSDFILGMLKQAGFTEVELHAIEAINRKPAAKPPNV